LLLEFINVLSVGVNSLLLVFNDLLDLLVVILLTVTQLLKLVHIVQLLSNASSEVLIGKLMTQLIAELTSPINEFFLMLLDFALIALHVRFIL